MVAEPKGKARLFLDRLVRHQIDAGAIRGRLLENLR